MSSKKSNRAKDSEEFNVLLIKLVKENQIIWNYDHIYEKHENDLAWANISKTIGKSTIKCKARWKDLRDRFVKAAKRSDLNWKHFKELAFLKDVVKCRGRGNLGLDIKSELNDSSVEMDKKSEHDESESDSEVNYSKNVSHLKADSLIEVEGLKEEALSMANKIGIKYGEIFLLDNIFFYCCHFCNEQYSDGHKFKVHCMIEHPSATHEEVDALTTEFLEDEKSEVFDKLETDIIIPKVVINNENENKRKDWIKIEPLKLFKCNVCDYQTEIKENFRTHGNQHPDKLAYKCDLCENTFTRYRYMIEHRSIHKIKGAPNCNICGKNFIFPSKFKNHIFSHTIDNMMDAINTDSKIDDEIISDNISDTILKENEDDEVGSTKFEKNDYDFETSITVSDDDLNCSSDKIDSTDNAQDEIIYNCTLCEFNSRNSKLLTEHGKRKHKGKAFYKCNSCEEKYKHYKFLCEHRENFRICKVCGEKILFPKHLNIHLKTHFQPKTSLNSQNKEKLLEQNHFECGVCEFETNEKKDYIEHCEGNHPNKSSCKCDICSKLFLKWRYLSEHRIIHTLSTGPNCKYCGKDFLTPRRLKLHKEIHINEKKTSSLGKLHREMLKCGSCEYETLFIKHFRDHCNNHIKAGDTPYKCWVCNRPCNTYKYLVYHMNLHRGKVDSACQHCGKFFNTFRSLKKHEKFHNKTRPTYKCQYCIKEFHYPETLKDHENIHTGNRPYKCSFCPLSFYSKGTSQTHMRIKHLNDKRFACTICEKSFLKRIELDIHEASHTGQKLYVCDICGNSYTTNSTLKAHLRGHANLRNYKCTICEKGFNSQNRLTTHMIVHSADKKWECDLCPSKFVCKKNLKQHAKVHLK